jgi:hypothetical protein
MANVGQQHGPTEDGGLRPEYRLLIGCAATAQSAKRREASAALASGGMDWGLVLETTRAQRVAALCYPALQELAGGEAPADVMAAFRAEAMTTTARNLRLIARLTGITGRAEAEELALVPYKGAVLGEMAYGNPGLREFVDLDFILRHRDLGAAWKLLEALGYEARNPELTAPGAAVPGEYVFLSAEKDLLVELHTELTLRHFPTPPDLEPLLAGREAVELAGRRVLTFSREDTLTLLAVHGAKDFWAQLLWICDIARLVETPGFDWEKAMGRADAMDCRRMVNVGILLAHRVMGAAIPAGELARASADRAARAVARWLGGRLFAPGPTGRREQIRYRMRMVEGFWAGLRYAGRLATTPAADDWNATRLPTGLRFAYALVRPLRLFRRNT